jgi:hypothetical protein
VNKPVLYSFTDEYQQKKQQNKVYYPPGVMLIPPSVIKGLLSNSTTWLNIFLISSNRFNILNIAVNVQIKYTEINIQYKMCRRK